MSSNIILSPGFEVKLTPTDRFADDDWYVVDEAALKRLIARGDVDPDDVRKFVKVEDEQQER